MTTGMTLLNAGSAADRLLNIIATAVDEERDLSVDEAHKMVHLSQALHCHALELQRVALGIPAPERG